MDIDSQAVEVTKLSLLLKVLEGATRDVLERQLNFLHERALPDLGDNIKCGNSLIGPDFYTNKQLDLFNDEDRVRINAFDWSGKDGFPQIMKSGGFDVVIGNPPYIRVRYFKGWYPEQADYLESHYVCATHVWDIYLLFFERAVNLSNAGARFCFIVPIQTLHQPNCEKLRKLLFSKTQIAAIADLSKLKVFQGAIVKNCVITGVNSKGSKGRISIFLPETPDDLSNKPIRTWPQDEIRKNPRYSLKLDLLSPKQVLCEKLRNQSWTLDERFYVTFGLRSCAKGVGQGTKDRLITDNGKSANAKPYLEGREIKRYATTSSARFIRYLPSEMYSPRSPLLFEAKKIISQSMLSKMRIVATLDHEKFYVEQSLVCIIPHGILTEKCTVPPYGLELVLAMINSSLGSFYFATSIIDPSLGGGLIHATPGSQGKLLIPKFDQKSNSTKKIIDRIEKLVNEMLALRSKQVAVKSPQQIIVLERQIEATDREIDQLVYQLYGLTDAEIQIVEEATAK